MAEFQRSGGRVESAEGWQVEHWGHASFMYRDGELKVILGGERFTDEKGRPFAAVYTDEVYDAVTQETVILDSDCRLDIANRIKTAFGHFGERIVIDMESPPE